MSSFLPLAFFLYNSSVSSGGSYNTGIGFLGFIVCIALTGLVFLGLYFIRGNIFDPNSREPIKDLVVFIFLMVVSIFIIFILFGVL